MELFEPTGGPDNVRRVASGELDFCVTSASHFLRAQQDRALPARFVAVIVQRSPMAGLVRGDSDLWAPADLASRRLGAPPDSALTAQFQAALSHRGVGPSALVPLPYAEAPAALGRSEIDIVPDFVDLLPRTRHQAGVAVRAIPVGPELYASGLVASDALSSDLVTEMRDAIVAALELQRGDPRNGLAALCDRYPGIDPADALEGWSLVEPNIFTGADVGSMNQARWDFTLDHLCRAEGLVSPGGERTYRHELLALEPAGESSLS